MELTRNQKLVIDTLSDHADPLGAYALLDRLREHGIRSPLQVYRALDKLIELGLVHKLESINAFVACPHPHHHDHGPVAFAICDRCGQVDEFVDEAVSGRLQEWARGHAFKTEKTTIEMHGTCAACNGT